MRTNPTNEQGKLIKKDCVVCGKEFSYYPNMRPKAAYCSHKCQSTEHGKKVNGKKTKTWKGSNRTRANMTSFARRHLPNKCVICGWQEANCDIHHIEPVREGGKHHIKNVIVVCPNHHRLIEQGKISADTLLDLWNLHYGNIPFPEEYFE